MLGVPLFSKTNVRDKLNYSFLVKTRNFGQKFRCMEKSKFSEKIQIFGIFLEKNPFFWKKNLIFFGKTQFLTKIGLKTQKMYYYIYKSLYCDPIFDIGILFCYFHQTLPKSCKIQIFISGNSKYLSHDSFFFYIEILWNFGVPPCHPRLPAHIFFLWCKIRSSYCYYYTPWNHRFLLLS